MNESAETAFALTIYTHRVYAAYSRYTYSPIRLASVPEYGKSYPLRRFALVDEKEDGVTTFSHVNNARMWYAGGSRRGRCL